MTAWLTEAVRCCSQRAFSLIDKTRNDIACRRNVVDQVYAFASENYRGIYIALRRRILIAHLLAIE